MRRGITRDPEGERARQERLLATVLDGVEGDRAGDAAASSAALR